MSEIELLKTIFKDSPDILEPLNEIDKEIERLNIIINKALEINKDIQEHLDKEFWIGRLELQEQILEGDKE